MSTSRPGTQSAIERSLNRQIVLEEDEYTEALSKIIARDFFPSLVHLDATNEYLDAVQSQDPSLINASVRKLQVLSQTPTPRHGRSWDAQTPFTDGPSETPLRTPRDEPARKRLRYDTDMSLDDFQARYTSEDNSSFTEILDDENRKRKEKWAWAWDAQKRIEAVNEKVKQERERMMIEAPPAVGVREKFAIEAPKPTGLITQGEEVAKAEGDDGSQQVTVRGVQSEEDVMAPKKDTRSAGVDGWEFKTRNSLMFSPDADVTPYQKSGSSAPERDPKVVRHGNTRLPEQEESTDARSISAPPSPTRSRIVAAISGTPYRPRSPTINNFSLVPNMPSPTPSELGSEAVKQLMTWGTLTGTPRILSQSDAPLPSPTTPFHLQGPSSRETISHRLSADASRSLRAKAGLLQGPRAPGIISRTPGGKMGPPSWTPRKTEGSLTPAAKRLLDRTALGTAAARRAEVMRGIAGWEGAKERDMKNVRWTPSPSPVTRR